MSTTRRDHLVQYLVKELGSTDNVKEFSSNLRDLSICDLRDDDDLKAVTESGAIDTLKVLYQMGVINKLVDVQKIVKE